MRLILGCLALELTRRCNMSCAHCLRSPAQNLDLDTKIIARVTTQADHIHSITFSEGELPSDTSGGPAYYSTMYEIEIITQD